MGLQQVLGSVLGLVLLVLHSVPTSVSKHSATLVARRVLRLEEWQVVAARPFIPMEFASAEGVLATEFR